MASISRTMRAGQWDPNQKRIVINDVRVPEPGPNELLVKIASASLCHSDIMAMDQIEATFTPGHEGVGYVCQVHESVEGKGFKVGDAVGFLYIIGCCFECEGCMVHNMLCQKGEPKIQGRNIDGFFAEYAVVDWRSAIILPTQWEVERSSVFFCAGITAFHSVDSCNLEPGQWLGVIGAGGLGQLATQYAKAMGLKVVAIDINDATLGVCKAQGADAIFNSKTEPEYVHKIKALTNGGAHAVAVFSNASGAYSSAPSIIRVGGLLMVVGIPYKPIEVSAIDMVLGMYRIKSESTGIPQRMGKALEFSVRHGIQPEVDLKRLEDLNDMVNQMRAHQATKRMAVIF
ncbi:alcohol dehydrogenase [Exophiala viscosa]|uniref:Alcohol dehydrogenase n=1 Tax=Exophiala viscosa TaxID=2486360 RepID=A0AAN6IFC6_9EURO|nr:alcohol dehydrogenase [Exophiala viscosa]